MTSASAEHLALEQAASWYLRLHVEKSGEADQQAWQVWHAGSALNQQAWQRVERMQALMGRAPSDARRTLEGVRSTRRRRVAALTGFLLVAGLAWQGVSRWAPRREPQWLATAAGERRVWRLPDGSRLVLGASSRVGVDFDSQRRHLHLAQGLLQVTTGHDAAFADRPLQVLARDGVIRPMGTRFTVMQDSALAELAVQESEVELRSLASRQGPVLVQAGQRVRFSADGIGRVVQATAADDAWTRGQLVVMNMPLQDFVLALSRHSGQQIDCDPRLAGLRVSGTYVVDDPGRSLASLAAVLGVRVERTAQGLRLRPRS